MDTTIQYLENIAEYFAQNYLNLAFILVFIIGGFMLSGFIQRRIRNRLAKKSPNYITATFTSQIIGFTLKSIVVFSSLYLLGLSAFTNKLLAGAGLLTFVIGFALKDIGENFLAGIILAFKSPFRLNDLIEVDGIEGFVKDINIRETLIKTPDGKDVFLPNGIILKNPLFNYTIDGFLRYEFIVGIAYENDPFSAMKLILETVNSVDGVLDGDKAPFISISELASSNINIKVQFWVDTFKSTKSTDHYAIKTQVMSDVIANLIRHGFSLPASILELKNYESAGPLRVNIETPK